MAQIKLHRICGMLCMRLDKNDGGKIKMAIRIIEKSVFKKCGKNSKKHTPIVSRAQQKFFGAELGRAESGKKTQSGMDKKTIERHLEESKGKFKKAEHKKPIRHMRVRAGKPYQAGSGSIQKPDIDALRREQADLEDAFVAVEDRKGEYLRQNKEELADKEDKKLDRMQKRLTQITSILNSNFRRGLQEKQLTQLASLPNAKLRTVNDVNKDINEIFTKHGIEKYKDQDNFWSGVKQVGLKSGADARTLANLADEMGRLRK